MMEQNMVVIRDPKTFWFSFEWPKDVDENLKDEIEFIINSNKSVAENKKKNNEIKQIFLKYKHGNNIHEHRKQKNEWTIYIVLKLRQILELGSLNKHVALQNVSIYYT